MRPSRPPTPPSSPHPRADGGSRSRAGGHAPGMAARDPQTDLDRPTDLPARSWGGALRRTLREAKDDHLTDWAAALTYYGILSLFPALLVLVALLGVFGTYPETTNALLDIVRDLGPSSAVDTFRK